LTGARLRASGGGERFAAAAEEVAMARPVMAAA